MLRIAIFASGNGTNAENIIKYFQNSSFSRVVLVLSNNKDAKVLERANNLDVATSYFTKEEFLSTKVLNQLKKNTIDFIVLAGFLLLMPKSIILAFPSAIINIHPALLPKYGGKGMYGMRVHEAVKQNNDAETGITIHYVNDKYDEGTIIFQKTVSVQTSDTPEQIASKVHRLEYLHFPVVIQGLLAEKQ